MNDKKIARVHRDPVPHWVGDGFPVRTLFAYPDGGAELSPFLMLDHAGPAEFAPAAKPRGVGFHPHRGFETVTIVYEGELEHRDSAGNSGRIGPGDVQWMTAASGVQHEEMHSADFTRQGGRFHVAQLWVNLPARLKMAKPRYQTLLASDILEVDLKAGAGVARVIAGELGGVRGPAQTTTPMNVWDVRLAKGGDVELPLPAGQTALLVPMSTPIVVNGGERTLQDGEVAFLQAEGERVRVQAAEPSLLLVLTGEPIREPIAGAGPFVMNTREEIVQAYADFHAGRF